jgi:hypothetical protein
MPKLVLKFDDRTINEYPVESEAMIGRLPDNTIVIDNPAVSSHHARVFVDGEQMVVEDLRSKNGTYVNEQHVVRATLKNGDVLLIAKHKIEYADTDEVAASAAEGTTPPTMGPTAYLDTRQHRARLARLRQARAARDRAAPQSDELGGSGRAAADPGVLRGLAGDLDESE